MALTTAEHPLEPDQRAEGDERAAILEEMQTSLDTLAFNSQQPELHRWLTVTGNLSTPVKLAAESRIPYSDSKQVCREVVCSLEDAHCLIEPGEGDSYSVRMTGTESDPDNPFVHLLALDPDELSPALDTFVLIVSAAIAQKKYDGGIIISRSEFDTLFLAIEDEADEREVPVMYSFSGEYTINDGRKLVVIAFNDAAGANGRHLPDSEKPLQAIYLHVTGDFRYNRDVEEGEVREVFFDDKPREGENSEEQAYRRHPRTPSVDQLRYMSKLLAQALKGVDSPVQSVSGVRYLTNYKAYANIQP